METSLFLARFFGLYLVIIAIFYFVQHDYMKKVFPEFFKNSALLLFTGIFNLLFGLFLVLIHNVWVLDWMTLITLLSYTILIKGLVRLFFPNSGKKMANKLVNSNGYIYTGILSLILGLLFIYEGFFAL